VYFNYLDTRVTRHDEKRLVNAMKLLFPEAKDASTRSTSTA
jgi:hypothetical protein